MTHMRIKTRKLFGPFLWLVVLLFTSSATFAQPRAGEVPSEDGISSYIFSPATVTVVLVLLLVVQLVYRHRVKRSNRTAPVAPGPTLSQQPSPAEKKRFDRDDMSMLLKASATSKNSGRTLEEAIRMTQAAHANLLESKDGHVVAEENAVPTVAIEHQSGEFESENGDAGSRTGEAESDSGEAGSRTGEAESDSDEAELQAVTVESQSVEIDSQSADAESQSANAEPEMVASDSEVETVSH